LDYKIIKQTINKNTMSSPPLAAKKLKNSVSEKKKVDPLPLALKIPPHLWKDMLDTSGYLSRPMKESILLAEAVCSFQGDLSSSNFCWIPLKTMDPHTRVILKIKNHEIGMTVQFKNANGKIEDTLNMDVYVPDLTLLFKNLLYYEIDIDDFYSIFGQMVGKKGYNWNCVKKLIEPGPKREPAALQKMIKDMVSQKRPLFRAEIDMNKFLRTYPLVKRTAESKKSILWLAETMSMLQK